MTRRTFWGLVLAAAIATALALLALLTAPAWYPLSVRASFPGWEEYPAMPDDLVSWGARPA